MLFEAPSTWPHMAEHLKNPILYKHYSTIFSRWKKVKQATPNHKRADTQIHLHSRSFISPWWRQRCLKTMKAQCRTWLTHCWESVSKSVITYIYWACWGWDGTYSTTSPTVWLPSCWMPFKLRSRKHLYEVLGDIHKFQVDSLLQ